MSNFIEGVFFNAIFDERTKEFPNFENDHHFLNGFNYFVGARLTHNRASMKQVTIPSTDFSKNVRKKNYNGVTDQTYKHIDTGTFGTQNIEYSSEGGYEGKGGFVHYFKSNAHIGDVNREYTQMLNDGLIDEKMISLTIESIFYNENYKVGLYFVYEFMNNNAGKVEVFTDTKMFQVSPYQLDEGQDFPIFSFIFELVYFMLVLWLIYEN